MNTHILKHDYGYGANDALINKLELNDNQDIIDYLQDVIETNFDVHIKLQKIGPTSYTISGTTINIQYT